MHTITRVEIRHFRSINELDITDLSDLNVFSGQNDVGKSNIVKALNLFFNGQVDWRTDFAFRQETNRYHDYYASEGRKKRHVQIKVHFRPEKGRYSTLPEEFWVAREWNETHLLAAEPTWGERNEVIREGTAGLTTFLSSCQFFYVPAVRERDFQQQLLRTLLRRLNDNKTNDEITDISLRLNQAFQVQASTMLDSLKATTGLEISIQLPQSIIGLLEAAGLYTDEAMPLTVRGDGIQVLSITGLLEYLSRRGNDHFFWGFEEPENSLEMRKASNLATKFCKVYSRRAQIFVTSHSPAFVALNEKNVSVFAVSMGTKEYKGKSFRVSQIDTVVRKGETIDISRLPDELGYIEVLRSVDHEGKEKLAELERQLKENAKLQAKIDSLTKPLVLVEGLHDVRMLTAVWTRLKSPDLPFEILPANSAQKLTETLASVAEQNHRPVLGIFDCDTEGVTQIQRLGTSHSFREVTGQVPRTYVKNQVKAILLPIPTGREMCARHKNMPLEFYFPDKILEDVDRKYGLFTEDVFINDGQVTRVGNKPLKTLITNGDVGIQQRQVKEPGKSALLERVNELNSQELAAFDALFTLVLQGLSILDKV